MTILYIFLALLMFGIMITVHEAGHFFAARLTGIPVKEFAIGFGPSIVKWKSRKHETMFHLRSIPVGGYCAFYGEDDIEGKEINDPRAFGKHKVSSRLLTILMGSVMNIVLALVVAFGYYAVSGVPTTTGPYVTRVQSVNQGSPAELSGIFMGDIIVSVDNQPVTSNLSELLDAYGQKGEFPVNMTVARGYGETQKMVDVLVTPIKNQDTNRYMLGIMVDVSAPVEMVKGGLIDSFKAAVQLCIGASRSILDAFRNLLFRGEGMGEMTGVVGVTQMIVEETQRSQLQGYLSMLIFISINLGLVNLFPFPGLDGSRFLFLVVEAVRGKPVEKEAYVHAAGMILLLGFMLFITLRDILRLF